MHVRKLCELDHERLIDDMYISDLLSIDNLSELVGTMNNNIQKALDSQALFKKKQLPVQTTIELKQLKQTVRNREQS